MNEIDISDKIKKLIKFGLPGLILLAVVTSSVIWYVMYGHDDLVVKDAKVASNVVIARTRAAGTVTEILVQDGDVVKAGDVIARIKVNVTEEQLKQLQQNVDLSQRNLEQLKQGITVTTPRVISSGAGSSSAEVEKARSRMERMQQLYEMGAVSAVKRDQAAAEYEMLAANSAPAESAVIYDTTVQPASAEVIKRAELQLRQAQAALDKAKGNSMATEITAPVDGTVYVSGLETGAELDAGQPVASIGTSDAMWVEAYLDAAQIDKVRLGQAVNYYIDRNKYEGLVLEIIQPEEAAEQQGGTEGEQQPISDKLVVKISIAAENLPQIKYGAPAEVRLLSKG